MFKCKNCKMQVYPGHPSALLYRYKRDKKTGHVNIAETQRVCIICYRKGVPKWYRSTEEYKRRSSSGL